MFQSYTVFSRFGRAHVNEQCTGTDVGLLQFKYR